MKPALILKSVRSVRNAIATNINRARDREFIPKSAISLGIETSSLCNLECRFCAYVKKQSPKVSMKDEFFRNAIAQALEMGYSRFDLTPCTGDVFMDRGIFNKLDHMENNPGVLSFSFFTNFTIPKAQDVKRLFDLGKLSHLAISIYGYDAETFVAITQSTEKVYRRLVYNLETFLGQFERRKFDLHISLHPGVASLRGRSSEITRLLDRFRKAGVTVKVSKGVYNNWGGYVTNDDVRDLPIDIAGPDLIYKNGACVRLFTTVQIMATGIVNGCACRDADATLRLGDLKEAPLRDIISSRNPTYMALIEEQQQGNFRPVCRSCDMYASIYHKSSAYRKEGVELETLAEFKQRLG
jgi:sulfatase maturation enzyme AslB (radical SAM superfamily)